MFQGDRICRNSAGNICTLFEICEIRFFCSTKRAVKNQFTGHLGIGYVGGGGGRAPNWTDHMTVKGVVPGFFYLKKGFPNEVTS